MRDQTWRTHAACRDMDTALFFSVGVPPKVVTEVCARCPVRSACLADALEIEFDWENHGHHIASGYRAIGAADRTRLHRGEPIKPPRYPKR